MTLRNLASIIIHFLFKKGLIEFLKAFQLRYSFNYV